MDTTQKIDGTAIWKRFVCSKEGWRKEQESGEDEKPKRKVKITRCGCEAVIGFKRWSPSSSPGTPMIWSPQG